MLSSLHSTSRTPMIPIWPSVSIRAMFLRVTANTHQYDFLLCYQCQRMEVYRDGVRIVSRNAKGSPAALNALLTDAGTARQIIPPRL